MVCSTAEEKGKKHKEESVKDSAVYMMLHRHDFK